MVALVWAGCSERIKQCASDTDCHDPTYPFCDDKGQFSPSAGEAGVCTIIPPECPVERCGCAPGATACSGDQLATCNADGHSTTAETCTLGCATSADRCLSFEPSNGLGAAMIAAAQEPPVVLSNVTIDTDTGLVKSSAGIVVPIASLQVARTSGNIQAFIAGSFELSNVEVTGTLAIAFVATGPISVTGLVDASATHGLPGPGTQTVGSCVGLAQGLVGSGGGNATAGGGAHSNLPFFNLEGGSVLVDPVSLQGGCNGGADQAYPGYGGGAVQLDSLTSVAIAAAGLIDVGGGGGSSGRGGGSGGRVILEAPSVSVMGAITANGGAGGACSMIGDSAKRSLEPAHSYSCPAPQSATMAGGEGGTVDVAPTDGQASGGGGGAVGRLTVHTKDGTFTRAGAAIISAATDSSQLAVH